LKTITIEKKVEKDRTIKVSKYPSQIYYTFMVFLSSIEGTNIGFREFIKFVVNLEYLEGIAHAFRKIRNLVVRWNYKDSDACRIVASMVSDHMLKGFISRLAQAIAVGMQLQDFIKIESSKYMILYDYEYGRTMERLKTLSEAFSAILTSVSFLSIAMLLTNMLLGIGEAQAVLASTFIMIALAVFVLNFFIYRVAPRERILHELDRMPFGLLNFVKFNKPLLVACTLFALLMPLILTETLIQASFTNILLKFLFPIPLPFMIAGFALFTFGRSAKKRIDKVKQIEEHYPPFLKSLGDAFASTLSLKNAIQILTTTDYGPLNALIRRLNKRLNAGISNLVCWQLFIEEGGSEMIRAHTYSFHHATMLGANPINVADALFSSVTNIQAWRQRRQQVAGYLKGIAIPLQIVYSAILVLVQTLLNIFTEFAKEASRYISFLHPIDSIQMAYYVFGIIVVTTIGTAIAIYVVEGESQFSFTYTLGLLLFLVGFTVFMMSVGATNLLEMFSNLRELIGNV
jgi:flagellar protein FlaJ